VDGRPECAAFKLGLIQPLVIYIAYLDAPGPDPVEIPEVARFQWKQTTRILKVEPTKAIENLVDWTSLYFHHKSTPLYKALQNKKIKEGDTRTYEVRVTDTGTVPSPTLVVQSPNYILFCIRSRHF